MPEQQQNPKTSDLIKYRLKSALAWMIIILPVIALCAGFVIAVIYYRGGKDAPDVQSIKDKIDDIHKKTNDWLRNNPPAGRV